MDNVTGFDLERFLAPLLQLDVAQIGTTLLLSLALGVTVAVVYRVSVPGRILNESNSHA